MGANEVAGERFAQFDVIRIGAALLVVVSHSFALVGRPQPVPLVLPGFEWTLGHVGVIIFFVASGFLVSLSWERDPSAGRFLAKRAVRIWPAFIVVVVLCALVLGPALTSLDPRAYLSSPGVWTYIGRNLAMSPITFDLPGVFTANVHANVNGSIWTLPYEVVFYLVLVVWQRCRLGRPAPSLVAFGGLLLLYRLVLANGLIDPDTGVNGLRWEHVAAFAVWFAGGVCAAQLRAHIVRRHAVGAVAVGLALAGWWLAEPLVLVPASTVVIVYGGTLRARWAERVQALGDPSYGAYLWAWPIQQVIVATHRAPMSPYPLIVASALGSIGAGYASWHLIEARALRRVRRGRAHPPVVGLADADGAPGADPRPAPAEVPAVAGRP